MTRLATVLALVAGCASPVRALRDDNRRLNETVSELRGDRRAQDRKLRDLQHQLDQLRAQQVSATIDGSMPPSLPVEVAAPPRTPASSTSSTIGPGQRLIGIAEDGSEIIYEGDAAAGKPATLEDDPPAPPPKRVVAPSRAAEPLPPVPTTSDRIEVTRKVPTAARPSPVASRAAARDRDTPSERAGDAANDYRIAVELVKAGKHDEAVAALKAFLGKYPHHDYADNAQYWLAESFYVRKEYAQALAEFRAVIETFPRGNKVPDALLKVGYCYQSLGQTDKARAVLEQVVNLYPKTEPAALASKRLEHP